MCLWYINVSSFTNIQWVTKMGCCLLFVQPYNHIIHEWTAWHSITWLSKKTVILKSNCLVTHLTYEIFFVFSKKIYSYGKIHTLEIELNFKCRKETKLHQIKHSVIDEFHLNIRFQESFLVFAIESPILSPMWLRMDWYITTRHTSFL